MNCPNCNSVLPENSAFCANCGTPIAPPPAQEPVFVAPVEPPVEAPVEAPVQEPVVAPVMEAPVPEKKEKKAGKKPVGLIVVCILLALLLAGSATFNVLQYMQADDLNAEIADLNDENEKQKNEVEKLTKDLEEAKESGNNTASELEEKLEEANDQLADLKDELDAYEELLVYYINQVGLFNETEKVFHIYGCEHFDAEAEDSYLGFVEELLENGYDYCDECYEDA